VDGLADDQFVFAGELHTDAQAGVGVQALDGRFEHLVVAVFLTH
jgi:hypothetical protein